MISLITHLKKFFGYRASKKLSDPPSDQSLRVLFAAPTYEQLCKLYHELKSDDEGLPVNVNGEDLLIPIHLLAGSSDASADSEHAIPADQLVKLRNSQVKIFLVLQEVGAQISQSSTTTSEIWGVDKIPLEFEEWAELPVIEYLFTQYALTADFTRRKKYPVT